MNIARLAKPNLFLFAFILNAGFSIFFDLVVKGSEFYVLLFFVVSASFLFFVYSVFYSRIGGGRSLVVVLSFYVLLLLSCVNGEIYGIEKAFLGLMVPLIVVSVFFNSRIEESDLVDGVIYTALFCLFVAIAYKLNYGFWTRSVRFGLFGSITFGWVMSFGFLSCMAKMKNGFSALFAIVGLFFFVAVIWSGSKGPLVGLLFVSAFMMLRMYGIGVSVFLLSMLALSTVLFYDFYSSSRAYVTFVAMFNDFDGYVAGAGSGSIGSRFFFYERSFSMFLSNPLWGVGFGSWGNNVTETFHYYPHNVFLELISEAGLFGGAIYLIFIGFLFRSRSDLTLVFGLFSLMSLMFSGDFSYYRYFVFFLLVDSLIRRKADGEFLK